MLFLYDQGQTESGPSGIPPAGYPSIRPSSQGKNVASTKTHVIRICLMLSAETPWEGFMGFKGFGV